MVLLFAAACAHDDGDTFVCRAPEQPFYDCQPISPANADTTSCMGGPSWRPYAGPPDAALTTEDPNRVFPDGCTFHLNECGCCYDTGRLIECLGGVWVEGL